MKTHSKALYQYLLEANVLHGSDDDIAAAKRKYRRLYKRQWKRQASSRKEIRFTVTPQQFGVLRSMADAAGIRQTAYVRNTVLASLTQPIVGNHDMLLKALQVVGMALTGICNGHQSREQTAQLLEQAEELLLTHLKRLKLHNYGH